MMLSQALRRTRAALQTALQLCKTTRYVPFTAWLRRSGLRLRPEVLVQQAPRCHQSLA